MYTKLKIEGTVEVVTGLHIGASSAFSAIGAVDSPVVKDTLTNLPMIPGSSIKGKMRTLLAKFYNEKFAANANKDHERILRMFGSSTQGDIKKSRLIFSDMILENEKELREQGATSITEVKFENTINRATAVANPRQIERVIRGSKFLFTLIYDMENEKELLEDMETLQTGLRLLQMDYLGGNGSRGYGKIHFDPLKVEVAVGELDEALLEKCTAVLNGAIAKN